LEVALAKTATETTDARADLAKREVNACVEGAVRLGEPVVSPSTLYRFALEINVFSGAAFSCVVSTGFFLGIFSWEVLAGFFIGTAVTAFFVAVVTGFIETGLFPKTAMETTDARADVANREVNARAEVVSTSSLYRFALDIDAFFGAAVFCVVLTGFLLGTLSWEVLAGFLIGSAVTAFFVAVVTAFIKTGLFFAAAIVSKPRARSKAWMRRTRRSRRVSNEDIRQCRMTSASARAGSAATAASKPRARSKAWMRTVASGRAGSN
jgi:hypothetical protein